jgi:hypothetical protein
MVLPTKQMGGSIAMKRPALFRGVLQVCRKRNHSNHETSQILGDFRISLEFRQAARRRSRRARCDPKVALPSRA